MTDPEKINEIFYLLRPEKVWSVLHNRTYPGLRENPECFQNIFNQLEKKNVETLELILNSTYFLVIIFHQPLICIPT